MKKMFEKMLMVLVLISIIILPNVFAKPTDFILSINDGFKTVTTGETLMTKENSVELTWTEPTGNGTIKYDVYRGVDKIATDVTSASYQIPIASESDGSFNYHVIAKDNDGTTTSNTVDLTIDRTPTDVVTSLEIKGLDNDLDTPQYIDIKDQVNNTGLIKLNWVSPAGEAAASYKLYYKIGTGSLTDITSYNDVTILGTTADIDISSNGLNLVDGIITFQVTSLDVAGNESNSSEIIFTYDTKAPRDTNNIVMKDIEEQIIPFDGISNSNAIKLNWATPTGEAVHHYLIYVQEGNGDIKYYDESYTNNIEVSTSSYNDGKITFKVTTVDEAGNESTGIKTYFNLDTTEPNFNVTYELGGNGVVTNIADKTINHAEKISISVINANNDISSYSVSRPGEENYIKGTLINLEQAIKAVSNDGLYTIKVKDAAGNIASLSFTFDQVYPELPSNNQLDVTSVDVEYREGVQAEVKIEWEKSTDATLDHYELWINGELFKDDITNPVTGNVITQSLTVTTIKYGNAINYYEVRVYDSIGNYGTYTIKKHTITDLTLPNAEILTTQSTDDEIIFTVELKDPNRVLSNKYARLYKNGNPIKKVSISTGINQYSFSDLDSGENDYQIKIIADFNFNGSFYDDEVLNPDTVYNIDTLSSNYDVIAEIIDTVSTNNSIDLKIKMTKDSTSDETVVVGVYDENGNQVDQTTVELDTDELETTVDLSFNSLTVGKWYQIRVKEREILATHNFFTEKNIPGVTFKIGEIEQNSISLNIIVKDEDNASTSLTVVLLEDGELVPNKSQSLVVGTNNVSFSGLDDNTEYEFKIYSDYNLQNGRGTVEDDLIGSYEISTAKEMPSIILKDIEVDGDSITFDSHITDSHYAIKSIKAILYQGTKSLEKEVLLNVGVLKNRKFEGLDPLTDYRINIEIEYDLNNSEGVLKNQLFYGVDVTTLKILPSVEVVEIETTNKTVDFSGSIIDPTGSYESGFIKLYSLDSAAPIQMFTFNSGSLKSFTFKNLKPESTYIIKVDADINLGGEDGKEDKIIYTKEFTTSKSINAEINEIQKTTDFISLDIDVINYIDETITAKLFLNNELLEEFPLEHGTNSLTFDDLKDDTTYEIRIVYSNGTKTLVSSNVKTPKILKLTVPKISIIEADLNDDNTVSLRVDVSDIDNAFTSDRVTIKICNEDELCTIQEIGLSILASGLKVELPYEVNYITVTMDYDAIDHTGKASDTSNAINKREIPNPIDPIDPVDPNNWLTDKTMVIAVTAIISLSFLTTIVVMIFTRKNKK